MPARLIEQQYGMLAGLNFPGDFNEMLVHRRGVAAGQNEGCALAVCGADRAEDIGGGRALIMWS